MPAGLLTFLIALFASLVLTVPVRALALRVGMVDLPGPRKVHLSPIPLLGGLAMYGGVVLAVLFTFSGAAQAQIVGILTGATIVAAVGILDDRGLLHHQIKLFLGMPIAACVLLLTGIHAQVFEILLGGRTGYVLDAILTVFFVVGITASFSILDHMDGLCAGVAAVASIFFAVLAYLNGQTLVTTLVTISRSRRGLLPFATPGKDHAAHRLANLGLGHRGAVLSLYFLGLLSGGAAVLVSYLQPLAAVLVAVVAFAIVLWGVMFLERAPYERQAPKTAASS